MLSFSPDFIAMLSDQASGAAAGSGPFQKVSFLVETGQYEAATETIKSVPFTL